LSVASQSTTGSLALTLALCAALALPSQAAEPFREFLDGLRGRDLHDVALDYIEQCRTNPSIDDETRVTLDFEQGRLLVEGARSIRDIQRRTNQLDTARAKFEAFIQANPEHPLAPSASTQLGNVLVERGRTQLERASRPTHVDQREPLTAEARQLFEQAAGVFTGAEQKFQAHLDSFPRFIDSKDRARVEAREQARLDLIQAQLYSAQVLFERAKSYPADSADFKKLMEEAGAKYAAIYDNNRRLMAGLYARMWQGRCQQELGNYKQALTYYNDLLVQPDDQEAFRILKAQTLRLAMQCWTSDDQRKYDEAIRQGSDWLDRARQQSQSAEGLAIRWLLAQAHDSRAQDPDLDPNQRRQDEGAALKHAMVVAQVAGDYQRPAKEFIARVKQTDQRGAPQNFAEARDAGKLALDQLELALRRLRDIEAAGNSEAIEATQAQITEFRARAFEMFRLALALDDPDTTLDDINQVRYFLCYLYYQSASPLEAAVMGEFLARRYPDSAGARPAARIALAAYLQAYNAASADQRAAEITRMTSIADYIVNRYSGQPEADEAAMVLADVALREKQFAQAAAHLARIPDASPKRIEADLKAGQALWAAYLALPVDDPSVTSEQREKILADARQLLERGRAAAIENSADQGPLLSNLAGAELSLAQLYLLEATPQRAVEVLERPNSGVLALAAAQHPAAARGNFILEAYKAALQAYVGTQALDRAQQMMNLLEQQAQATGESGAALTRIYLALGRELERQVARLRTENKQDELQRTLKSFDQFLDQIAASPAGNSFNSLTWIAQTYVALGSGLTSSGKPAQQSRAYYEKAARAYDRLLQAAAKDPAFAPQPEALVAAKIQLARCDRLLGNYQESLDTLVELLKQRPTMLDAQVEAAETYQAWGATDPNQYNFAVHGGRKAKKPDGSIVNIVWGWRKIAATVQQNPKFQSNYYDAVYHLAQCAIDQAASRSGADREKSLNSARSLIEQLARTRPDLGGDEWFAKFDALLRRIEGDLGLPLGGLKKLQQSFTTQAATP